MPPRWDIFCTVVDNYGDIGIAWRLARQLAAEHGLQVRLWVDDLSSFARLRPEIDPVLGEQRFEGVEVCYWPTPFPHVEPADVVIEALACHLPERYVEAMAVRDTKPVWINLEYLSAEDWVTGCHALPSPHPRLPLTKHFYFPGWHAGGGVLCERGLARARQDFQSSTEAKAAFWQTIGLPLPAANEIRASLFSYSNQAIPGLLEAWASGPERVCCLVPVNPALADVVSRFDIPHPGPGSRAIRGNLSLHILPWLPQDTYDRLLWACDLNFVRGEDSFVRAQWAEKPLVWQAYRQEDGAHWPKIEAFLNLYCQGLDAEPARGLAEFWRAWNEEGDAGAAWPGFWRYRGQLGDHAARWSAQARQLGDLAANLVNFCGEKSQ